MWVPQLGFNYGQVSTGTLSKIASPQFVLGSRLIEHGIVTAEGNLQGRLGTYSVGTINDGAARAKMVPFEIRGDRPYVFEITAGIVRIWDVEARSIGAQTLTVPYSEGDLKSLQFARNSNTLAVVSEGYPPHVFTKPRNGEWSVERVEDSLIVTEPDEKLIRLRTAQDPGFNVSFSVFSGPDGDEDLFFEDGDVDTYFRIEDGWSRVESRTSAFEVVSDYLDSPPPFGITTKDWVGPFVGEGTDLTTIIHHLDTFYPGDLLEITAYEATDGVPGTPTPLGLIPKNNFFRPDMMGGIIDIASTDTVGATPVTPLGSSFSFEDRANKYVFQMYDVRENGTKCAVRCIRVFGGSHPPSDTMQLLGGTNPLPTLGLFVGPEIYRPQIRDVPNTILQPSWVSGDISLFSNAALFGSTILNGDVIELLGGSVRIDSIQNPNQALATVLSQLDGLWSTDTWGVGANASSGFPSSVAFHQDRLILGGVPAVPGSIFVSRTARYTEFARGPNASDGIALAMTSQEGNAVRWIQSMSDLQIEGQGILAVGTDSAEFRLQGPISPTEGPSATPISFHGSRGVQPVSAGNSLLFVVDSGKVVRDLRLHSNVEYPAEDITLYAADQFRDSPPLDMAYLREPYGLMVVVRGDGSVTSCSYRRDLDVNAWIPWPGLKAQSVCAVKRTNGDDELWFAMERNGQVYVEAMAAGNYLDAAIETTAPTGTVTGLDHLEGETVMVRSASAEVGTYLVSGGAITVPASAQPITVGLPSVCRCVVLLNESEDRKGVSYGRYKQCDGLRVLVTEESSPPRYSDDDRDDEQMELIEGESVWYQADALSEHRVVSRFEIRSRGGDHFEVCGFNVDSKVKDI